MGQVTSSEAEAAAGPTSEKLPSFRMRRTIAVHDTKVRDALNMPLSVHDLHDLPEEEDEGGDTDKKMASLFRMKDVISNVACTDDAVSNLLTQFADKINAIVSQQNAATCQLLSSQGHHGPPLSPFSPSTGTSSQSPKESPTSTLASPRCRLDSVDKDEPSPPIKRLVTSGLVASAIAEYKQSPNLKFLEQLESGLVVLARVEYDWLVAKLAEIAAKSQRLPPGRVEEVFVIGLELWVEFWDQWGKGKRSAHHQLLPQQLLLRGRSSKLPKRSAAALLRENSISRSGSVTRSNSIKQHLRRRSSMSTDDMSLGLREEEGGSVGTPLSIRVNEEEEEEEEEDGRTEGRGERHEEEERGWDVEGRGFGEVAMLAGGDDGLIFCEDQNGMAFGGEVDAGNFFVVDLDEGKETARDVEKEREKEKEKEKKKLGEAMTPRGAWDIESRVDVNGALLMPGGDDGFAAHESSHDGAADVFQEDLKTPRTLGDAERPSSSGMGRKEFVPMSPRRSLSVGSRSLLAKEQAEDFSNVDRLDQQFDRFEHHFDQFGDHFDHFDHEDMLKSLRGEVGLQLQDKLLEEALNAATCPHEIGGGGGGGAGASGGLPEVSYYVEVVRMLGLAASLAGRRPVSAAVCVLRLLNRLNQEWRLEADARGSKDWDRYLEGKACRNFVLQCLVDTIDACALRCHMGSNSGMGLGFTPEDGEATPTGRVRHIRSLSCDEEFTPKGRKNFSFSLEDVAEELSWQENASAGSLSSLVEMCEVALVESMIRRKDLRDSDKCFLADKLYEKGVGPGVLAMVVACDCLDLHEIQTDDLWALADKFLDLGQEEASLRIRIRAMGSIYEDLDSIVEVMRMAFLSRGIESIPARVKRLEETGLFALKRAPNRFCRKDFAMTFGACLLEPLLEDQAFPFAFELADAYIRLSSNFGQLEKTEEAEVQATRNFCARVILRTAVEPLLLLPADDSDDEFEKNGDDDVEGGRQEGEGQAGGYESGVEGRERRRNAAKEAALKGWAQEIEFPWIELGWLQWKAVGIFLKSQNAFHPALPVMWAKAVRGSFKTITTEGAAADKVWLESFDWGLEGILCVEAEKDKWVQLADLPLALDDENETNGAAQATPPLSPAGEPSTPSTPSSVSSNVYSPRVECRGSLRGGKVSRHFVPNLLRVVALGSSSMRPLQKKAEIADLLLAMAARMSCTILWGWPRRKDNAVFIAHILNYCEKEVGMTADQLASACKVGERLWGWSLPNSSSIRLQSESDDEAREILQSAVVSTWREISARER